MEARLCRRSTEAGMVTAELALALPTLVLVLALALSALATAADQVRCVDAARIAARAAARGDPQDSVLAAARRAAPEGTRVTIQGDREVAVSVSSAAQGVLQWWHLPVAPSATATAAREWGAPG